MTLAHAVEILKNAGVENPLYDARQIFSKIGNIPMERLVLGGEVADGSPTALAISKRAERIPLEYLIGYTDFYKEQYIVAEGCLIPRDDTECLVDFAVKNIPEGALFIDLCTGSGCIALSVLNNTKDTVAIAADISDSALDIARKNADRLKLSERVSFIKADVLEAPVAERCFALLSNPPYVTDGEYPTLTPEIHNEPKIAFVGGEDGLKFYKRITALYRNLIDDFGFIAFEIGYDQGESLAKLARLYSCSFELIKDYSGNDRVVILRK